MTSDNDHKSLKSGQPPRWRRLLYWFSTTLVGTIVLGALGSGLWVHLGEPILHGVTWCVLSTMAFLQGSFRESVYTEIARGRVDRFGSIVPLIWLGVLSAGWASTSRILQRRHGKLRRQLGRLEMNIATFERIRAKEVAFKKKCEDAGLDYHFELKKPLAVESVAIVPGSSPKASAGELFDEAQSISKHIRPMLSQLRKQARRAAALFIAFILTIIFSLVFILWIATVRPYETAAYEHFDQVMTICQPFIDPLQAAMFRSRFSQIRSAEDYRSILGDLEDVGKAHQCRIPNFSVW